MAATAAGENATIIMTSVVRSSILNSYSNVIGHESKMIRHYVDKTRRHFTSIMFLLLLLSL